MHRHEQHNVVSDVKHRFAHILGEGLPAEQKPMGLKF